MRKVPVVLLLVCLAAPARAQESREVKLVSPSELSLSLPDHGAAEVRVFYTAPRDVRVTLTDAGPLVAGTHVGFDQRAPARPYSFVLRARAGSLRLKPGEKYSGSIVFRAGTAAAVFIPFTVTRPAPAFTATATPGDLCFACGEPRAISVQVTNSGPVSITSITVGSVLMTDASRGHRWILPRGKKRCGATVRAAETAETDGKIVVRPCSSARLDLRPGEARTVSVAVDPPQYAGDYATSIEMWTDGAPATMVSLVARIRGPWLRAGWSFLPPLLFVLTVLFGFASAHRAERVLGSGGGARRTRALISLRRMEDELVEIEEWARPIAALTRMPILLAADLANARRAIKDAAQSTPDELEAVVKSLRDALEKRRRLRENVTYARAHGLEAKLAALDSEPDTGTPDEYAKRLRDILISPTDEAMKAQRESQFQQDDARREAEIRKLEREEWRTRFGRGALLFLLSLLTAYGLFYAKGCNFGSLADYGAVFVWALGLTQAGRALAGEVPRTAQGAAAPPAEKDVQK